nr:serine/threonine-protein kinase [Pyxidicoccus trucidator]
MERRGWGSYGAVYRALGVEDMLGPVALKVALHPGDGRFAREVELLSRLRHPSVPRLVDHGLWLQPGGVAYPYLAMEWIEGVSLYDWAHMQCPTSRQVLRVLASLARALEATHAAGGVHRDVKGDNVLVRAADGQVFLTDFGSGSYVGAGRLTSPPLPPGTQPYRTPEAWRSVRLPFQPSDPPYAPGPADDVFALGMTAYRLVTDDYPPTPALLSEVTHLWGLEGTGPVPPLSVNARCCVELSRLVSRMLSVRPEARGGAGELAEALEQAARSAGPEADVPLFTEEETRPTGPSLPVQRVTVRPPPRVARWPWFVAGSLSASLALGVGVLLSTRSVELSEKTHLAEWEEAKDGGTIAVGDTALTAPVAPESAPSVWSAIQAELPPKPFPNQRRPDGDGRCSGKGLVAINGGCWVKLPVELTDCDFTTNGVTYRGACYVPVWTPQRPSTSGPTNGDNPP